MKSPNKKVSKKEKNKKTDMQSVKDELNKNFNIDNSENEVNKNKNTNINTDENKLTKSSNTESFENEINKISNFESSDNEVSKISNSEPSENEVSKISNSEPSENEVSKTSNAEPSKNEADKDADVKVTENKVSKKGKSTRSTKGTKGTKKTSNSKTAKGKRVRRTNKNKNAAAKPVAPKQKSSDISLDKFLDIGPKKSLKKKPKLLSKVRFTSKIKKARIKTTRKRGRPRKNEVLGSKPTRSFRDKQLSRVTNEDVKKVFETKLRRTRLILGLTQIQMADKIGMSVDFYRDIETGRNTGSIATMLNLCNVLKVPSDQFFEDLLNYFKYQSRDYTIQQYFNRFSDKDKLALKRLIIYLDKYYSRGN